MTTATADRAPSLHDVIAQLFLGANLAVFFLYAGAFLLAPRTFAAYLDITLGSPSALADLRAMYGGLCLGVGTLFALGIRQAEYRRVGILLATLTSAGLMLGRLVTIAVDGVPGTLVLLFLGSEIVSVSVGLFLLRNNAQR